jgi:hypothetical protein
VDAQRRSWLETLADACDRVLDERDRRTPYVEDRGLLEDAERLRDELRAELAQGDSGTAADRYR